MKYIESISDDVYFNLALEEYIFNSLKDDTYFMLWKNENSIVMGKHQNAYEEINIKAIEQNNIKVARRNTGGGTVFHDRGNLNYSVITDYDKNTFIDYDKFIIPVINALNSIGVKAEKRRTSDIAIDGKKISGSAQTIKGNRALHHGTLLFSADLTMLHDLLKTTEGKIESKSVKSVRSIVTNIREHLIDTTINIDEFQKMFADAMFSDDIEKYEISQEQIESVNELVENKYSKWEWSFGASPDFYFEKESAVNGNAIKVKLNVKKGIVTECNIQGINLTCGELEENIIGSRYSYIDTVNKLKEYSSLKGILNINYEELADCFF
ncbi:lipoate--protein ligase [Sedimentibacter hydroxybenzoicus DSM 7310]|uniref:lipoate--protein ligase n=1 Tax=Sedimentibacter hydroxybenzoicus DSM 7310 TaxID=1123245 RepID=A0A974BJ60_SEDHY|nr:lipoate--protein ligase [Sedimentibacter hydroxybenzoicus]NYB74164.1 lipoate--protein ligase [Sedimentibacter hydroxybenzoicus DSM 7310]